MWVLRWHLCKSGLLGTWPARVGVTRFFSRLAAYLAWSWYLGPWWLLGSSAHEPWSASSLLSLFPTYSEMHHICIADLGHFETSVCYLKEIWVLCCDACEMEGVWGWLCKFTFYIYLKMSLFLILENLSGCFWHIQRWRACMVSSWWCENCVFTIL